MNCSQLVKGLCLLTVLALVGSASGAKMRTWTSKKGDTIVAEYVKMFGSDKVVVKKSDGKILTIPISGLCTKDQEHLTDLNPPKVEINVNVSLSRKLIHSKGYSEKRIETVTPRVTVNKKSTLPYNRKLVARIYIFAKPEGLFAKAERSGRWLIICNKRQVSFKDTTKVVEFPGTSATVEYTTHNFEGSWIDGYRYEGYLAVVEDDAGEVLAMESTHELYEKNWEKIKNAKAGTKFDRDFKKTLESIFSERPPSNERDPFTYPDISFPVPEE